MGGVHPAAGRNGDQLMTEVHELVDGRPVVECVRRGIVTATVKPEMVPIRGSLNGMNRRYSEFQRSLEKVKLTVWLALSLVNFHIFLHSIVRLIIVLRLSCAGSTGPGVRT